MQAPSPGRSYCPRGAAEVWKKPSWAGSSSSCAPGAFGKEGKTPTKPCRPSCSCRNKPMVVVGVSSALSFWGWVLWDELEHPERENGNL